MIPGLPGCGLSALYYLALAIGMGLTRLWGMTRAGLARFHKRRLRLATLQDTVGSCSRVEGEGWSDTPGGM